MDLKREREKEERERRRRRKERMSQLPLDGSTGRSLLIKTQ